MNYLKFNCFDLAAKNTDLFEIHRKMKNLSDELAEILKGLDPYISNYECLKDVMADIKSNLDNIVDSIFNEHDALDRIVDTYYAAENKATELSEALPAGLGVAQIERGDFDSTDVKNPKVLAALTNNGDLILEDWLLELVYRDGSNYKDE